MGIELVLLTVAATIIIGSVCGVRAAFQIGTLRRRLAALEGELACSRLVSGLPAAWPNVSPLVPDPPPVVPTPAIAQPPASLPAARPAVSPPSSLEFWRALELRAGTRWITWLGAAALVIAAALFLKLAIDEGWLGPIARLSLGAAAGIGLLGAGWRAHRAEMRPLSQGLFGAGLGVLYVVTYLAFSTHGLIARELAFAAMVGITVTGSILALRHDAQPVALLALVGGLVTPVAVSSGSGGLDELCTYLLVLDLGAFAIALVRGWRAVELTAVLGSWILFGGWLERYHAPETWRGELAWLGVLHVVFLALPVVHGRWQGHAPARSRLGLASAGAVIALGFATAIADGQRQILGAAVLVLAATYAASLAIPRRDRLATWIVLELACVTLGLGTLAVPLVLDGHAITLGWIALAPIVLAIGFRMRQPVLRFAAFGVLVLAAGHHAVHAATLADAATPFANASYAVALGLALAGLGLAGLHGALARGRSVVAGESWLRIAVAIGGATLALIATQGELAHASSRDLASDLAPLVWVIGAAIALAMSPRVGRWGVGAAAGFAAIAGLLVIDAYGHVHAPVVLALNARFAVALATVGWFAVGGHVLARRGDVWHGRLGWTIAAVMLGCVIGVEASAHHGLVSIAWAGYAAGLLGVGFRRANRALRLGGLSLLGLVAAKLVLHDLAGAAPIHRVLSFLVVGALMIAVSLAYHRLERRR